MMKDYSRPEYYLKIEKMSVGYQGVPLIENIEIGIQKGEILTLIGPNGAGKSTVLKSIARQLALIDGVVYLDKENLTQMSGSELSKKMAVVLTEKLRTEMMTCEDVAATGRYPYTGRFGILSDSDRKIVAEAMDMVHVTAIKDRDFKNISDGQRQRVMLARAICQEPEIIILDEPTSFLDVKYKLEFLSILQEMKRRKGLTVIMSLHELELAQKVSDKILCINGKCVECFGEPEKIFRSGYITKLFGIESGSFDEENGNMELEAVKGDAKVFVIGGGGTAKNVYRSLQRQSIPFMTGIIFRNDIDYSAARALATEVIEAEEFEPIAAEVLESAKRRISSCEKIICCKETFGTLEMANKELLAYAREQGKVIQIETHGKM